MSPDPVELGEKEKTKVFNERRECANGWKIFMFGIVLCQLNLSHLMNHLYDEAPCLPCCLLGRRHLNLKETERKNAIRNTKYTSYALIFKKYSHLVCFHLEGLS